MQVIHGIATVLIVVLVAALVAACAPAFLAIWGTLAILDVRRNF